MSDKAIICVPLGEDYELYYRDSAGEPSELGNALIRALQRGSLTEALEETGATRLGQWVRYPDRAFLDIRPDIHWIYVVREEKPENHRRLTVYKTSYDSTCKRFAWQVWSRSVHVLDRAAAARQMELVQTAATMTAGALGAYERAV